MKHICLMLIALVVSSFLALAEDQQPQPKEVFIIVKVSNFAGQTTPKLLPPAELKEIQDQIAKEGKFFEKAMAAAEKAWKADELTAKKSFPRTAVVRRKAVSSETFSDQSKGEKRLEALEKAEKERDAAEQAKEADRAKKKNKPVKNEDLQKAKEKADLIEKARDLFKEKLDEIIAEAAAKAEEAAKKEPAKAE